MRAESLVRLCLYRLERIIYQSYVLLSIPLGLVIQSPISANCGLTLYALLRINPGLVLESCFEEPGPHC